MLKKDQYNMLSEKEKYYFQQIEYYSEDIPYMSINELAEKIYSSPASLSRLVNKLGYTNFKEFKTSFSHRVQKVDNTILGEHINKILSLYPQIIDDYFMEYLNNASKIYIVAFGSTSSIAQELALTLIKKGYDVSRLFDSDFMHEVKSTIAKEDLIIYISNYGMDIDMQSLAVNLKFTNKQILITSNSNAKLAMHVSLIINTHSNLCNFPFTTRLPLELLVTIICMRIHGREC